MTIPGIGAVAAVSYVAAIEDPDNFKTSRSVGAWLGLTTRRYQSGEVDYDGHISRRGDPHLRGLLYEAATVILTRTSAGNESSLKSWGSSCVSGWASSALRWRSPESFQSSCTACSRQQTYSTDRPVQPHKRRASLRPSARQSRCEALSVPAAGVGLIISLQRLQLMETARKT